MIDNCASASIRNCLEDFVCPPWNSGKCIWALEDILPPSKLELPHGGLKMTWVLPTPLHCLIHIMCQMCHAAYYLHIIGVKWQKMIDHQKGAHGVPPIMAAPSCGGTSVATSTPST